MSTTVCLFAKTIDVPRTGGHLWAYLNCALGLRALGCRVIWMEAVDVETPTNELQKRFADLKIRLKPYGFGESIALCSWNGKPLSSHVINEYLSVDEIDDADLLLNMGYGIPGNIVRRFRRSALLDIDPGLTQIWIGEGQMYVAPHDIYFTIGETVGQAGQPFPDLGLKWQYIPPCVALHWWPIHPAAESAAFTTVSQWYTDEWVQSDDGFYRNDKRTGFLPLLELPQRVIVPLELALALGEDEEDRAMLRERGWRVRNAMDVASTPWDYQRYIQNSLGEFSCAKPSCTQLQNGWISDRTLCYLASGKPAVVQHTGPSRFLPDRAGLFRFRDLDEAVQCLDAVAMDYERQCRFARALAEEHFDARKVVRQMLERALT